MTVYHCEKCLHRIKHEYGPYYTCTYCGENGYHVKNKRSENPPRFHFDERLNTVYGLNIIALES